MKSPFASERPHEMDNCTLASDLVLKGKTVMLLAIQRDREGFVLVLSIQRSVQEYD